MSDLPKRSNADILLGLLFSTGIMLIIVALPVGIELAFLIYRRFQKDLYWAIIGGAAMTAVVAIIGVLSYGIGTLILKRRRKAKTIGN